MYNKEYFRKQLIDMLNPIEKYYDGGNVKYSQHSTWYEDKSADMEAFARPLWGLVPFWAGGGSDDRFKELYIKGIADGTDENSDGYWGVCHERDQRFVEMASLAYGILFTPDIIWKPLSDISKDNLEKWLNTINDHAVCDSNWIFFRILVNIALKSIGRKYSEERLEKDLNRIDEFYLGNGWYKDGEHGQRDYYIAFAFHFYGLVYAMKSGDEKRSEEYKKRAFEFAKTFIYWFDEDGEAVPYGRSLTYRFAQCAFWSACIMADIRPFPIDVMKGIIVRNLDNWIYKKDIFDHSGILTVGYDYPDLLMSEVYNAHGSPYWSLKAYAFLMLPDNHEFWTAEASPMPKLEKIKVIGEAEMIISRRNGKSVLYPAGNNEAFGCGQIVPKYLKFAYSSHFGFNVMKSNTSVEESGCDNMLVFDVDGQIMYRRHFNGYEIVDNKLIIKWSPFMGIDVITTVIPTENGHIREHEINSEYDCIAYDCGFAVAARDIDGAVSHGGDSAEVKNGFQCCSVYSQTNGTGFVVNPSANTNLRYRKTLIPAAKYEIKKGNNKIITVINDYLEEK